MRTVSLAVLACTFFLAACGRVSEEDKVKQAVNDDVQALKDTDGEKWCDSVPSPELAEAPRDERKQQIELCKDDSDDETLSEAPDRLGDPRSGTSR